MWFGALRTTINLNKSWSEQTLEFKYSIGA